MKVEHTEAVLRDDAAYWRAEHERLGRELATMTPGHADAIGPAAVRRLQVDHETALQLAREAETRLELLYPQTPAVDATGDQALF